MGFHKKIVIEKAGFAGKLEATAYWRVANITGGKRGIFATFVALVGDNQIDTTEVSFVPDMSASAPDLIAQAYIHAKTLPQFQGAEDA
jgi:hypothetical protein